MKVDSMASTLTYRAGIPDAQLLRALADEIPACSPDTRVRLRDIADHLENEELSGTLRCVTCGNQASLWIRKGNYILKSLDI